MLKKIKLHLHRNELAAIKNRYKDAKGDDARVAETLELLRCIPLHRLNAYYPQEAMDILIVTGCSRLSFLNTQIDAVAGMLKVAADISMNWYTDYHLLKQDDDPEHAYIYSQKSLDRLVSATGVNALQHIHHFVEQSIKLIEQYAAYEEGYPDYLREASAGLRPVFADVRTIALAINDLYQRS